MQDYIWNKGTRCNWAVTEFQVMCLVVGVSSLVLVLLFMIVVFFAKRLHHLKNENRRLRRHRCVSVCRRACVRVCLCVGVRAALMSHSAEQRQKTHGSLTHASALQ